MCFLDQQPGTGTLQLQSASAGSVLLPQWSLPHHLRKHVATCRLWALWFSTICHLTLCSSVVPGESVSSDIVLGCDSEVELSGSPWQTCEEDPELNTPTDVVADPDARHWLQLSPTDASNLTGNWLTSTNSWKTLSFLVAAFSWTDGAAPVTCLWSVMITWRGF